MEIQRALHQINAHMAESDQEHCVSELIILFCQKLKNVLIYTLYNIQHTTCPISVNCVSNVITQKTLETHVM